MSEEKKERIPLPPQLGELIFEGRKAAQFWVRAFDFNSEIEAVQEILTARPERKRAAVPIVAEYEVDERFKFIFVMHVEVDALGIRDGLGIIYWANPEHEKEIFESRNKHADSLIKKLEQSGKFEEMIEMESKREK